MYLHLLQLCFNHRHSKVYVYVNFKYWSTYCQSSSKGTLKEPMLIPKTLNYCAWNFVLV